MKEKQDKKIVPPFSNKNLNDFFEFQTDHQDRTIFIRDWITDNFYDLEIRLTNHLPTFFLEDKKIFYLRYVWNAGELHLQISFNKGYSMRDDFEMFEEKNSKVKSILIDNLRPEFLDKIKKYIKEAINLEF